jgi:hypothetical protein
LARTTTSAANAALLVEGNSIKDRLKRLKESEGERMAQYKKTIDEWNERNKVPDNQVNLAICWLTCAHGRM